MNRVVLLWLLLSSLLPTACRSQSQMNTVAERLYQQHILTAQGRDLLQKTAAEGRLQILDTQELLSGIGQFEPQQGAAALLTFCAQVFTAEMLYRTNFSATPTERKQQAKLAATASKLLKTDTAAAIEYALAHGPAAIRIESAIPAEDKVILENWTIYPPLGQGSLLVSGHFIHESRSVLGKTRTRLARDLHALGLLSDAAYQQV